MFFDESYFRQNLCLYHRILGSKNNILEQKNQREKNSNCVDVQMHANFFFLSCAKFRLELLPLLNKEIFTYTYTCKWSHITRQSLIDQQGCRLTRIPFGAGCSRCTCTTIEPLYYFPSFHRPFSFPRVYRC